MNRKIASTLILALMLTPMVATYARTELGFIANSYFLGNGWFERIHYANGRWWIFAEVTTTTFGYSSSTDGSTWLGWTTLLDGVSDVPYHVSTAFNGTRVDLAWIYNYDLSYASYTLNADGTLTARTSPMSFNLNAESNQYKYPANIILDSGQAVITWNNYSSTVNGNATKGVWCIASTETNGVGFTPVANTPKCYRAVTSTGLFGYPVKMYGDDYMIVDSVATVFAHYFTAPGVFYETQQVNDLSGGEQMDFIYSNGKVYAFGTTAGGDVIYRTYTVATHTWAGPTTVIDTASPSYPRVCYDDDTSSIYVFTGLATTDKLYGNIYNATTSSWVYAANPPHVISDQTAEGIKDNYQAISDVQHGRKLIYAWIEDGTYPNWRPVVDSYTLPALPSTPDPDPEPDPEPEASGIVITADWIYVLLAIIGYLVYRRWWGH